MVGLFKAPKGISPLPVCRSGVTLHRQGAFAFSAGLAHLVEQSPCKRQAAGSSPATGTIPPIVWGNK